jgi:hypothetical protein
VENNFTEEDSNKVMEQIEPFPDRLCDIFEAEKEILLSEIKKAGGKFTHGSLKGTSGEQVAKNFIRRYTHSSYGFANGQIIDSSESISNEVDIAICNPSHPMTYSRGGQGILFIEAVDAVIEIKSTITNLDDLKDNCKSVRDCRPDNRFINKQRVAAVPFERIDKTPYAVFAFSSNLSLQTIADRLNDWEEKDRYFIDLIYVVGEGIVYYDHKNRDTETDNFPISSINQGEYGISPFKPDLPMFFLYLSDKMPEINAGINPLPSYFNPGKY